MNSPATQCAAQLCSLQPTCSAYIHQLRGLNLFAKGSVATLCIILIKELIAKTFQCIFSTSTHISEKANFVFHFIEIADDIPDKQYEKLLTREYRLIPHKSVFREHTSPTFEGIREYQSVLVTQV